MDDSVLERFNHWFIISGFHPFYFYAALVWLCLLALRSWHWRRLRVVRCEVCDHVGYAKNDVRGTWKAELMRFVLFVPAGFFLHILMGLYLTYFLIRWFVTRRCEECGSEKLVRLPESALPAGYVRNPAAEPPPIAWNRIRTAAGYAVMVGASVAVFFFIRSQGEQLPLPQAVAETAARVKSAPGGALGAVLLSLAAVIIVARMVGLLFQRLGQPAVIGEIVAGIMLGPSVLGALMPEAYNVVLPNEAAPYLGIIANIGVVLFMFLVGLELNTGYLRGRTHTTVAISHASILAPFLLGSGLAYFLYDQYSTAQTSFTVFALFAGISLSVTAFPVLARILTDRNLQRTPLGVTAITCASVDDVTAWLLLAFASSVAAAKAGSVVVTVALFGGYMLLMMWFVKPFLRWLTNRAERKTEGLSPNVVAAVFVGLLLSALLTETIGIHALFGAFMLGALIRHDSRLAEGLRSRLHDIVVVLFLPAFFAFTGMRTEFGLLSGAQDWAVCGLIIVLATVGKFGGSAVAARLTGMSWRDSAALGALMNTRGLMELIVLNVGLDLGVLTPKLFTMLVIMAIVTTFATSPVILWLQRRGAFGVQPLPRSAGAESTFYLR